MGTIINDIKTDLNAVLTADIVNSTILKPASEKKLIRLLEGVLSNVKYEFYRGDSFQVLAKPSESLRLALLCRVIAIGLEKDSTAHTDIRISLAIGKVMQPVKSLGSAKGEAFLLSGRGFDAMEKNGPKLVISTPDPVANTAFEIIANYVDHLLATMTPKQATIIKALLTGETQQEIAQRLNKSKSTISQHAEAGNWKTLSFLLQKFEQLINQL